MFHAAGVARVAHLSELTEEIVTGEFCSKVTGFLNLRDAIAEQGLCPKFLVLFSSLASVLGGYGMAAYAGANRVLDSFAQQCMEAEPETVCINWDDWRFDYGKEQMAAYERTAARFAITPEEGLECLLRILGCHDPIQLLVSTRPLAPRIQRWATQLQIPDHCTSRIPLRFKSAAKLGRCERRQTVERRHQEPVDQVARDPKNDERA